MTRHIRKYLACTEGVSAVEFALIAPIMLTFMLGFVDYGFYINASMKMESLARAGAEYVLKGGEEDSVQSDIVEQASLGLTEDQIAALDLTTESTCECRGGTEVSCTTGTCGDGDFRHRFITVEVSMPYEALMPYPGLPDSVEIRGRARLQVE